MSRPRKLYRYYIIYQERVWNNMSTELKERPIEITVRKKIDNMECEKVCQDEFNMSKKWDKRHKEFGKMLSVQVRRVNNNQKRKK